MDGNEVAIHFGRFYFERQYAVKCEYHLHVVYSRACYYRKGQLFLIFAIYEARPSEEAVVHH